MTGANVDKTTTHLYCVVELLINAGAIVDVPKEVNVIIVENLLMNVPVQLTGRC